MAETTMQAGFGLHDKPQHGTAVLAGLQHLLAVFGGIVTAPLLIALGMNLPADDIDYLVGSALVISGIATAIQVLRVGPIGSGLLSIQGTSFTFVGPLIYLYTSRSGQLAPELILGQIFMACVVCALLMMMLARGISRLQRIMTPAVAGTTVVLLGLTLIATTVQNLIREISTVGWRAAVLAGTVLCLMLVLALAGKPLLRLASIAIGLVTGLVGASLLGLVVLPDYASLPAVFVPEPLRYAPSFDLGMVLVLLPIFVVSATESVGDLTATASLSGEPVRGEKFLARLRGGISADALNSAIAGLFATFPNTTFSQNNGVIRLTGVASRRVGLYVALLLILVGTIPAVAATLRVLPASVIGGATLLMFALVALSGWHILGGRRMPRRTAVIAGVATLAGLAIPLLIRMIPELPATVATVFGFPVSTGAFVAMLLEGLLPPDSPESLS